MISKITKIWPQCVLAIYLAVFGYYAYKPLYMPMLIMENSLAVIPAAILVVLYCKGVRFSNIAYTLILIALWWQTVGGHYCFGDVPFGYWLQEVFNFKRNNFDRIGHFMVGFFAFAAMEYFESRELIRSRGLTALLVVMAIFGVAGIFEIIEWIHFAITKDVAFQGTQGDLWDPQKDMLCDGMGAVFTAILYAIRYKGKNVNTVIGYIKR